MYKLYKKQVVLLPLRLQTLCLPTAMKWINKEACLFIDFSIEMALYSNLAISKTAYSIRLAMSICSEGQWPISLDK